MLFQQVTLDHSRLKKCAVEKVIYNQTFKTCNLSTSNHSLATVMKSELTEILNFKVKVFRFFYKCFVATVMMIASNE
jgi:hypothetical protein